jgi:hypothetical protein
MAILRLTVEMIARRRGLVQNPRLVSPFDWQGPNAGMVAEFAYSAIRALQLIV